MSILTSAVPPNKREEWIEKQVQCGIQVLITNPSIVETGLDLNDFTTLYYYNIAYNLFTLRQSSRRSWRINQHAPRIEVYFSYYEGTMQHRAIRLMASKLAVAGIIEGNFTDEGLAAMSDCADMTTALARELTQGIKNEVEDLSAVFKKMAILKPLDDFQDAWRAGAPCSANTVQVRAEAPTSRQSLPEVNGDVEIIDSSATDVDDDVVDDTIMVPASIIEIPAQSAVRHERPSSGLLALTYHSKPLRKQRKKPVYEDKNQLSLFDMATA